MTWWLEGERHRRTFPSEHEAASFRSQLHRELGTEPIRVVGLLTIGDVVDNWYRGHSRNLSSGTRRDYEGRIRRDVARIGNVDADFLARNPRRLRDFYSTLTPTNARRLHAILRQAFQDAVDHGELVRNPCEIVKARRPRPSERRIPSPEEVEKIVIAAEEEDPIWGLFLNLSATLGTVEERPAPCAGRTSMSLPPGRSCVAQCARAFGAPRRSNCRRPAGSGL